MLEQGIVNLRMPPDQDNPSALWRRFAPLFACTAASGLVTVMLGPLLPALILRWHIQDAQAGTLFTASFLGQLVGAWFGTYNLRFSLLGGAALSAAGTAALAWTNFDGAQFALFAAGLGLSACLTAGNVVVGTTTTRRAHALAFFNACWSIGAIASSGLAWFCGPSHTGFFFLITAAIATAGGLFVATLPRSLTHQLRYSSSSEKTAAPTFLPLPTLTFFALSMLVYVGNEHSLGGWLPSFAIRNDPAIHASTIALLYWLFELVSRLTMASLLHRISETVFYRASLLLLFCTQAALILAPHPSPALIYLAVILSGAAMGPLYPLIMAFLLARTGNHPWLGRLFASCSLGGATLPWFTGMASTYFGSLRAGLLVPAAGTLLLLILASSIFPRNNSKKEDLRIHSMANKKKGQATA